MENLTLDRKSVLVVDDEVDLREIISSEMEFLEAKTFQASNVTEAKKLLSQHKIDLIITDIRMPEGTGIDLLDHVRHLDPALPPVILITGFADITLTQAYAHGAEALLNKPFQLDELIRVAHQVLLTPEQKFNIKPDSSNEAIELNFKESLPELMQKGIISFGRGGMFLVLDSNERKIKVESLLDLNLSFSGQKFQGTVIVRWAQNTGSNQPKVIGMEFLYLTEENRKILFEILKKNPTSAYIPCP
jgi:CheY-like chemotaxis protein